MPDNGKAWRVSAIVGPDADGDGAVVEAFNGRPANRRLGGATVDTVELRLGTPAAVAAARTWSARGFAVFCELPADDELEANLDVIAGAGLHAKIRTGGAPGAAPTPAMVSAFLCGCAARGVAVKATAGLHHALTGSSPALALGFVNVVLAAGMAAVNGRAAARDSESRATVTQLLSMGEPAFGDGLEVVLRGPADRPSEGRFEELAAAGRSLLLSIGTCSFEEPVAEARRVGLLP